MPKLRRNPVRQLAPKSDTDPGERYFTDGSNLYCFVEWLTSTGNVKFATVEDCRTLGLLLVSGDYLGRASLRGVRKSVPARSTCFAFQAPCVKAADPDGLAMAVLCMRGDFADFDAVDRHSIAAGHLGSKGLERG